MFRRRRRDEPFREICEGSESAWFLQGELIAAEAEIERLHREIAEKDRELLFKSDLIGRLTQTDPVAAEQWPEGWHGREGVKG
jgi:hypothetical protein